MTELGWQNEQINVKNFVQEIVLRYISAENVRRDDMDKMAQVEIVSMIKEIWPYMCIKSGVI